jgi:hypothetical protein
MAGVSYTRMTSSVRCLILLFLLAGCAAAQTSEPDTAASAPEPGTLRVHANGTVGVMIGGTR